MRLATRLNLLTLALLTASATAVLASTAWLMRDGLRSSQARVMHLELQAVSQTVLQRLERTGLVAARSAAAAELQRLRAQPGMASASLLIVDRFAQRVVYHPTLAADTPLQAAHVLGMLQREQGVLSYDDEGAAGLRRTAEFTTLQPIGWLLALSLDQHEIDAPLSTLLGTLAVIGLLALALGALLSQLFARGLSQRLAVLLEGLRRIETGDLAARLPATGADDELRRVEHGVNALARHLAQRAAAQQASQAALDASENRLRQLFDANLIGVVHWTLDGRILDANDAFLSLVGHGREALADGTLDWFRLTPPDEAPLMRRALAQMHAHGLVRPYERHCLHRSGHRVPVMLGSLQLDGAQPPQCTTFVVDMSAREQAEANRRAHHEADAASRAKSAFLASMSHEIRTPMNAILGLTHLMLRESAEPRQIDRMRKVDSAARHLLRLINDILDLSKIEAGKMVLEEVDFAVDALLDRVVEFVREPAQAKGLELVIDTDHLPPRLVGDPTRLAQMLTNLLANAVKFTAHGFVRLRGELVSPDTLAQAADGVLQVRFEVQDTGEGIAPERQQAIFEAFEQADGSTTRRHGGTGLGLALTRHLAQLMGGEVGVHSVPGEGSTFWASVQLRPAPAEPLGLAEAAPPPPAGLRALVVDDLPEAREALAELLRQQGFAVTALASGEAALAQVQAELDAGRRHDLMLVDWRMAPMDGFETLAAMRALLGPRMPPAVLVTAFDDAPMRARARALPCDAVLLKPLTASALQDALPPLLRPGRAPADPVAQTGAGAGAQAQAQASPPAAVLRLRHAGQRVLLVEDNPINQEVAADLLRSTGLQVDTAADGQQALAQLDVQAYDLVLMDMQMPVLDGLEATRLLRLRHGPALPVIAMTANAFGDDRLACLAAGMDDHLPKPVDPERLYAMLLRWLPAPMQTPPAGPAPGFRPESR